MFCVDPDIQHTDTSGDSPILMESPPTEVLRLEKAKRIRQIASFEREMKDSDDETALLAREMLPLSKQSLEHITRQLEDKLNSVGTVKFQSDMITVPCPPNSLRMMDWALISPSPAFSYSNNVCQPLPFPILVFNLLKHRVLDYRWRRARRSGFPTEVCLPCTEGNGFVYAWRPIKNHPGLLQPV